jgi:hypothetical protein
MIAPLRFKLLSFLGSLAVASSAIASEDPQARELDVINHELNSGLQALVTRVKADKISPPLIHSEWYVSESSQAPTGQLAFEQQKRQFGRRLLESIDRTSGEILAMTDSPSRERIATTLLDLGDWISERPGYGNMFITERCQDMATVPLAHLVADLRYPESKLDALTARLWTWVDFAKLAPDALNTELPQPIFAAGQGKTLEEVQEPLMRAYRQERTRVQEWVKANLVQWTIPDGKRVRESLPADLRFFCDDEVLGFHTTLELWDVKNHRRLVSGLGGVGVDQIRHFLLFRKKVGRFPTEAPAGWTPGNRFNPPVRAAFAEAWEPYRKDHGPIYDDATLVYTGVVTNTFCDRDTTAKRIQQAASATRPSPGRLPAGRGPGPTPRTNLLQQPGSAGGPPVTTRPSRTSAWLYGATKPASPPASRPDATAHGANH